MQADTRSIERSLIKYVIIFLWLGLAGLTLAGNTQNIGRLVVMAFLLSMALLFTHLMLVWWKIKGDLYLFPLTSMLTASGLIVILRLNPEFAFRQFIWLLIGLVVFLITVKGLQDYKKLEDYKYVYIYVGLLLLLTALIFGVEAGGARSWLAFGPLRFQSSEIVKIILVIFLASYLEEEKEVLREGTRDILGIPVPGLQYIGPLVIMWGLSLMLLVFQKDLGTALIFFGTFLAMIFIATGRWSYFTTGTALFIVGAVSCYFIFDHVRVRVATWLNPWVDIEGKGYQIIQSLFAIGSGGLYGTGLGLGQPTLIPAVHTDFVFSAWSEETGLIGAMAIIIVYCLVFYRGFRIALRARSGFGQLLAAGLTSLLALQTLIIIGGNIKLLPLTGVTLPFISYGGSSLLSSYILLGLLVNISAKDGT